MKDKRTKEPQNQVQIDTYNQKGPCQLGPWTSYIYRTDPRHLGFLLARYKFVGKMLAGKENVLEVGCGDAFGLPVVLQQVASIHAIDFEPLVLDDAKRRLAHEGVTGVSLAVHDIIDGPVGGKFDAAYSLDVIEHIPRSQEDRFMSNICASLLPQGVCIIGTPNLDAEKYSSPASKEGHVNLKNATTLRELLLEYFYNVFIFSMNDEVVHTGFYPMAHYLFGMGVGLR
jgi:2-polyprenyl-3-methyl-5-hydroxy-6-metoxy-1,4-benzoquinol methylase